MALGWTRRVLGGWAALAVAAVPAAARPLPGTAPHLLDPMANDKLGAYEWVRPEADYVRREVMIPMRDGVQLHTVIVVRKGVADAPILLSRTPYDASATTARTRSQKVEEILPIADAELVRDGYIRVYQDVRGLHGSEGDYIVTRPLRGPLNHSRVDHSTDAWDTIDWLVKNVKVTNGKVAVIGSSYLGFTALMALIDPHPALKAAVPESPMVDGWIGDDWFHNGAFRQPAFDYLLSQVVERGAGRLPFGGGDEYDGYLADGSAAAHARRYGVDQLAAVRKLIEHPAYDAFWQAQAVDKLLAARPLTVPTLLVVGQWDQEDSYGAPAVWRALSASPANHDLVSLAIGPWRHSGVDDDGSALGPLRFPTDTAREFRSRWLKPFLDCHLKTQPPPCHTPRVITYATGVNRWEEAADWPDGAEQPLYLAANHALSTSRPPAPGQDSYVSDPASPVPMLPRPIRLDGDAWNTWLVQDQRFVAGRPDVLTYQGAALTAPLHLKGAPRVELHAATSGEDSDFVVKLIDVYPSQDPARPDLGGYELPLGIEIFRGRYLHSFANPAPLEPGKVESYGWSLPHVDHVFLPGHRIMVQVQSSLFPLYDRNPQGWTATIMDAKPEDYRKATQTVHWGGATASAVWLPEAKD